MQGAISVVLQFILLKLSTLSAVSALCSKSTKFLCFTDDDRHCAVVYCLWLDDVGRLVRELRHLLDCSIGEENANRDEHIFGQHGAGSESC